MENKYENFSYRWSRVYWGHLIDLLISKGYKVMVIDNLSLGKIDNINP